jgi:hypothetical protein
MCNLIHKRPRMYVQFSPQSTFVAWDCRCCEHHTVTILLPSLARGYLNMSSSHSGQVHLADSGQGEPYTSDSSMGGTKPNTNNDSQESCASCMYTGMATCTGLSLYFFKMALDSPEKKSVQFTKHVATNKRFFLLCGTAWAAAGVYRWHLGWRDCSIL